MVAQGTYLLVGAGFSRHEEPYLLLQKNGVLQFFSPLGERLSLTFDTRQRFCTGWHNLEDGSNHPCPDTSRLDDKYDQCASCQQKTGFNPAFYNATSVSPQQEKRNSEPHILYLAHFGPKTTKVGISHAARGRTRLLEQGARSALILETFPTAHIARSYEARIAALPGIAETLQLRRKIDLFGHPYQQSAGEQALKAAQRQAEAALGVTFDSAELHHLDAQFFPSKSIQLADAYDTSSHARISGTVTGMFGSFLFTDQEGEPLFIPIKKYTGFPVLLSYKFHPLELPARQVSLL